MIEFLFIRHGATQGNLQRRYIGRSDEGLCELGRQQTEALRTQGLEAGFVFVSPMRRTLETARILFPAMRLQPVADLRECDFGDFEGKTAAELEAVPAYRAWVEGMCEGPIPGGEEVVAFKARCCRAFMQIAEQLPKAASAALVTHGGVIMSILEAYALPRRDFYTYHIGNAACLRAVYAQGALHIAA